jgi:uncharacterized protein
MNFFPVTSLYAPLLALLLIVLSNIVSAQRARYRVSIGDGGEAGLLLWIRRHGNLAESLALALLLMALAEARGLPAPWLHGMGVLLVVARLLHVIGLNPTNPAAPLRIAGGVGTYLSMLIAIVWLLWGQISSA